MDLDRIKETIRTVKFDFLSEKESVSYRLGKINPDFGVWMEDHSGNRGSLAEMIETLVERWSLTAHDEMILPTREMIEQHEVPTPYLRAVVAAIFDDASPSKLTSAKSS